MADSNETMAGWLEAASQNAGRLTMFGVIAVIAGVLALAMPWASGVGVAITIGVALLFGGTARLVGAFSAGSFGRGALAFIGAALTLLAGAIMVVQPGWGLATLTLMLGAFLLADGVSGALLAFQVKPAQGWGWMLFSAAMSLLLGFLLLNEWPLTGLWAIGTLFGAHLLFAGLTMISISSAAKRASGVGEAD